jgi:hypothetical protein
MRRSDWVEIAGRCRYAALLSCKQIIERICQCEVQNIDCSMVIEVDRIILLALVVHSPAGDFDSEVLM